MIIFFVTVYSSSAKHGSLQKIHSLDLWELKRMQPTPSTQSLLDVYDIDSLETLIILLQQRVGSTVSFRSLSLDLRITFLIELVFEEMKEPF